MNDLLKNPIHFFAFGCGSGLASKAPGTIGTLFAIFPFLLLHQLPIIVYLTILVASFVVGVYFCGRTAKDLNVHDHPGIVWDEFVGFWVTMTAAPSGIEWIVIGFILFRFFDIFKPWPIYQIDNKISGGVGIMLDDIVAGVYAFILLQIFVQM